MSADANKPITVIEVLCDPKQIKRIALTCKCDNRWVELVPGELHDTDVIMRFACPKCGQGYLLRNHKLIREDRYGPRKGQTNCVVPLGDGVKFDA